MIVGRALIVLDRSPPESWRTMIAPGRKDLLIAHFMYAAGGWCGAPIKSFVGSIVLGARKQIMKRPSCRVLFAASLAIPPVCFRPSSPPEPALAYRRRISVSQPVVEGPVLRAAMAAIKLGFRQRQGLCSPTQNLYGGRSLPTDAQRLGRGAHIVR